MTKELRTIFTRTGEDAYGPKPTNPLYAATTADGRLWKVERHFWLAPSSRWAWAAEHRLADGSREHKYGDTLEDLAFNLGFPLKGWS
jgi:hypothetical protein